MPTIDEVEKEVLDNCPTEMPTPLAFVMLPDGKVAQAVMQLSGEGAKEVFGPAFAAFLHRLGATGYVMVCEVLMTTSHRPLHENIRVSDLPPDDRAEAIEVLVVEKGKEPRMSFAIIDNKPSGKQLRPWKKAEEVGEGRMIVKEW